MVNVRTPDLVEAHTTLTQAQRQARDDCITGLQIGMQMLRLKIGCRPASQEELRQLHEDYPLNAHARDLLGKNFGSPEPVDDDNHTTLTQAQHQARDDCLTRLQVWMRMLQLKIGGRPASQEELRQLHEDCPLNAHARALLGKDFGSREPVDDDIPSDEDSDLSSGVENEVDGEPMEGSDDSE